MGSAYLILCGCCGHGYPEAKTERRSVVRRIAGKQKEKREVKDMSEEINMERLAERLRAVKSEKKMTMTQMAEAMNGCPDVNRVFNPNALSVAISPSAQAGVSREYAADIKLAVEWVKNQDSDPVEKEEMQPAAAEVTDENVAPVDPDLAAWLMDHFGATAEEMESISDEIHLLLVIKRRRFEAGILINSRRGDSR